MSLRNKDTKPNQSEPNQRGPGLMATKEWKYKKIDRYKMHYPREWDVLDF